MYYIFFNLKNFQDSIVTDIDISAIFWFLLEILFLCAYKLVLKAQLVNGDGVLAGKVL